MVKYLRKFVTIILTVVLFFNVFSTEASAGSGQWIYNKGGWTVRLDSPDGAKPYYHLHFYKKGRNIYCLRLDNMKPLLVAGAGALVVVSAVIIFTGPIDDIAAWAALSAALGM